MNKTYINELRRLYPEHISLDQMYHICGISKRSALYLIQHKIIPSINTGKKTWRYKIALDDVIVYLQRREQVGSMIPPGCASSRHKPLQAPRRTYASFILQGEERAIADYFSYIYSDWPDTLTSNDLEEMTGLSRRTILQYIRAGWIKSLWAEGKYIIPKPYLLDFVQTRKFIEAKSISESFLKILGGFEKWKTAK